MTAFTVIRPRLQRLKVLFYIYERSSIMKKIKCTVCGVIYGSNIKKSIDCTKCAILSCFETKLSATDKTVVDDFVDNYN